MRDVGWLLNEQALSCLLYVQASLQTYDKLAQIQHSISRYCRAMKIK